MPRVFKLSIISPSSFEDLKISDQAKVPAYITMLLLGNV